MERLERPERAVDAAASAVRAAILGGQFAPGDRLPAERDLAASLGINRLTLRAALARLESEGLVKARQGDGVLVRDWRTEATLGVLAHVKLAENLELVRAVLELRRAVAAEAVGLACTRVTDEELAGLDRLAVAQALETDERAFAERDLHFGRQLLSAAHNPAMMLLLNTVEAVYRAHPLLVRALHADRESVAQSYRGIVELLRARDADEARRIARQALEMIDTRALDELRAALKRG